MTQQSNKGVTRMTQAGVILVTPLLDCRAMKLPQLFYCVGPTEIH